MFCFTGIPCIKIFVILIYLFLVFCITYYVISLVLIINLQKGVGGRGDKQLENV